MINGPANPKSIQGSKKVDLSLFPPIGLLHGAHAMMDGARKYNAYNWRDQKIEARIYTAAAIRHILAWQEGEESAEDSGAHHLGHALACCAILLDAQASGALLDNRVHGETAAVLAELQVKIEARAKQFTALDDQKGSFVVRASERVYEKKNPVCEDSCSDSGSGRSAELRPF